MSDQALPLITELCPKPSSGSEWIELYNPATETINLAGWQLWDQLSQPSLLYTFADFSLAPNTFVVVEVGKKLNDTGDGVVLLDAESKVIDNVSYQSAQSDLGYSRIALQKQADFAWQITTPNSFLAPTIAPTPPDSHQPTPTFTETTPSPALFLIPTKTPTPLKSPTPSKTPSPTPLPTPIPKAINTSIMLTPTPSIFTTLIKLQPSISIKPPATPSLDSLITQVESSESASHSSEQQLAEQPSKLDRLVFFPISKNPFAALNVIIGGLVICSHAGITVWLDWQKHRISTYY